MEGGDDRRGSRSRSGRHWQELLGCAQIMTTHNKNSPHHPRPTGQDLTAKIYKVQDATGKVFGGGLTWDEAWKLKEQVAGSRKSTTLAS